jgi:hypothetical protein
VFSLLLFYTAVCGEGLRKISSLESKPQSQEYERKLACDFKSNVSSLIFCFQCSDSPFSEGPMELQEEFSYMLWPYKAGYKTNELFCSLLLKMRSEFRCFGTTGCLCTPMWMSRTPCLDLVKGRYHENVRCSPLKLSCCLHKQQGICSVSLSGSRTPHSVVCCRLFRIHEGDPSRWPRGTIYPQTLALTSPTSGGRLSSYEFHCSKLYLLSDRLCSLVVRVPGYTTEMYCVSCEVRTEFIYVM